MTRILSALLVSAFIIAGLSSDANAQRRQAREEATTLQAAPAEREVLIEADGSGDPDIQAMPAPSPSTSGTATQPEQNEGSEDAVRGDVNSWSDGNGNGGASQGGN